MFGLSPMYCTKFGAGLRGKFLKPDWAAQAASLSISAASRNAFGGYEERDSK
jgi:hypothetical protein